MAVKRSSARLPNGLPIEGERISLTGAQDGLLTHLRHGESSAIATQYGARSHSMSPNFLLCLSHRKVPLV